MATKPPARRMIGDTRTDRAAQEQGTTTQRGLGWDWQQLMREVKARHPLCIDCERRGVTRATTDGHHVVPRQVAPERRLDPLNVAPLCRQCHERWEREGAPDWWGGLAGHPHP